MLHFRCMTKEVSMSSDTHHTKTRDRLQAKKNGRARKRQNERKGTTPTKARLFGDEPAKGK
jgi:hypothetical protein